MTLNIFRISDKKKEHGVTTLSWRIESHKLGKRSCVFVKRKKRDRRIEEPQRNCKWNEFLPGCIYGNFLQNSFGDRNNTSFCLDWLLKDAVSDTVQKPRWSCYCGPIVCAFIAFCFVLKIFKVSVWILMAIVAWRMSFEWTRSYARKWRMNYTWSPIKVIVTPRSQSF